MKLTKQKLKEMILAEMKEKLPGMTAPRSVDPGQEAGELEQLKQQYKHAHDKVMELEFSFENAQSYEEAAELEEKIDEALAELHKVQAMMQRGRK